MTWVLIGVVLLVAFGPVLWLVPSRRDRRLAALRNRARAEGLVVDLRRVPKPEPTAEERVTAGGKIKNPVIECATYGLTLRRKLEFLPGWRVVRSKAHEADGAGAGGRGTEEARKSAGDPFPGWHYDQRPKGDERRYLDRMLPPSERLLGSLPDDVVAFEIGPRSLLAYWLERPGSSEETVSMLAAALRGFEAEMTGLEDEIRASLDINDS